MNKKALTTGLLLAIGGVLLLIIGLMPSSGERQVDSANWSRLSDGAGKEVQGTVVSSQSMSRTEGARRSRSINTVYCPVYDYSVNETKYSVTGLGDDCLDEKDQVVVGSTKSILYDAADPKVAFVNSEATKAFYKNDGSQSKVVLIIIGSILLVFGVIGLYMARPKTPEQLAAEEVKRKQRQAEIDKMMAELDASKKK